MPVDFLTNKQKETYGKFPEELGTEILHKYFHLDDFDKSLIQTCRRDHNKLGCALQLTTVRFIGAFLANPLDVPEVAKAYLANQLGIVNFDNLNKYLLRKVTKHELIKKEKKH